ncbi:hypothetical protein [Pontibacter akesuensis]|uniref:hypothetical protein n=1 Tax=Pontibacter akesuensis TaxID=388950 RepID=UPI00083A97F4|nr:hypothetical protein [Pontibacter akesuensis]GHA74091.1 hypothetical protein GCM10007389_29650 [Pontibacter akesuensis]
MLERIGYNGLGSNSLQQPSVAGLPAEVEAAPDLNYKMPIMRPNPATDFQLLAIKPDSSIHYHLLIIKPE